MKMSASCRLFLPFTALLLTVPAQADARADNADSLASVYRQQVSELSSPARDRRNEARRALQQQGYSQSLAGVLRHDALDAAFAYLRMRLLLEFFLPHDQLFAYFPIATSPEKRTAGLPGFTTFGGGMIEVPLGEDWRFPADPWERRGER